MGNEFNSCVRVYAFFLVFCGENGEDEMRICIQVRSQPLYLAVASSHFQFSFHFVSLNWFCKSWSMFEPPQSSYTIRFKEMHIYNLRNIYLCRIH